MQRKADAVQRPQSRRLSTMFSDTFEGMLSAKHEGIGQRFMHKFYCGSPCMQELLSANPVHFQTGIRGLQGISPADQTGSTPDYKYKRS
ncbi:hypothetical protein ACFX1T_024338 [Malus domestica]